CLRCRIKVNERIDSDDSFSFWPDDDGVDLRLGYTGILHKARQGARQTCQVLKISRLCAAIASQRSKTADACDHVACCLQSHRGRMNSNVAINLGENATHPNCQNSSDKRVARDANQRLPHATAHLLHEDSLVAVTGVVALG